MGHFVSKESLLYFKQKLDTIFAKKVEIPVNFSQLNDDVGYAKKTDIIKKVSLLENDSRYQTASDVETTISGKGYQTAEQVNNAIISKGYQTSANVQSSINAALADITGIDFKVVSSLPSTGVKGTIYMLSNSGSGNNVYDEYIYLTDAKKYEKIGTTDVDLSNYYNTSNFTAVTNSEIDSLF